MSHATQVSRASLLARTAWWIGPLFAFMCSLFALLLYWRTAAPGLTWAHEAADGGELLAAAWRNGVPHPPGYPLYMLLLRGWLLAGRTLDPASDLARLGNLLSVLCAATSVGVTALVAAASLPRAAWRWLWAGLAALAWAVAPLLWSQAIVTEVYALHALLVALLGWAVFNRAGAWPFLMPVIACGVAHHLTFVLLLPAVVYLLWQARGGALRALLQTVLVVGMAIGVGLLFYLRTPWAASGGGNPPPVNWGYADNWTGFWWLVSGAAYRSYLFGAEPSELFGRLTGWAYTVTTQYTPVGLALGLVGLAAWDRERPVWRNFSILWVVPVSAYAIAYYTRDSEIYLLPVAWLMAVWLAVGLHEVVAYLTARWGGQWPAVGLAAVAAVGLVLLLVWRLPDISLRSDREAQHFVSAAAAELQPGSILISLADDETFALWYGAWASGELLAADPDLVLVNYSLYQFDWYRRLLRAQYPNVVGDTQSVEELLATQAGQHPIFFSEQLSVVSPNQLSPSGPLWRYQPD
jgi:hypothetical protein